MKQLFWNSLKIYFRNKSTLFWVLVFPIALGTLFYIAFSSLSEQEMIDVIPVAAVCEQDDYGNSLKHTLEILEKENFVSVTYCEEEAAKNLLESKEIIGILHSGDNVKITISAKMSTEKINQSILQAFVEEYNIKADVIENVMKTHPERLQDVLEAMDISKSYQEEVSLQKNPNVGTYTQYYYNLIAMSCLYAALIGLIVATENQANLSALGARKNISGTKKSVIIFAQLSAAIVFEFVINMIGFLYLAYVLKTGVDEQLPYALLTLFTGEVTGISFGYMFGSIGSGDKNRKIPLVFAMIMPCCFLSGLMVGNIRIVIDLYAPIINKINPAALIADSFYCLSIFEDYSRFTQNIVTLFIMSFLFMSIGLFLTRRTKYASI